MNQKLFEQLQSQGVKNENSKSIKDSDIFELDSDDLITEKEFVSTSVDMINNFAEIYKKENDDLENRLKELSIKLDINSPQKDVEKQSNFYINLFANESGIYKQLQLLPQLEEVSENKIKVNDGSVYKLGKKLGEGAFGIVHLAGDSAVYKSYKKVNDNDMREALIIELLNREGIQNIPELIAVQAETSASIKTQDMIDTLKILISFGGEESLRQSAKFTDFTTGAPHLVKESIYYNIAQNEMPKLFENFNELALSIDSMHNLDDSVFHIDIKPSNIAIDQNGKMMLIDFGLSKLLPNSYKREHFDSKKEQIDFINKEYGNNKEYSVFNVGGTNHYMHAKQFLGYSVSDAESAGVNLISSLDDNHQFNETVKDVSFLSLNMQYLPNTKVINKKGEVDLEIYEFMQQERKCLLVKKEVEVDGKKEFVELPFFSEMHFKLGFVGDLKKTEPIDEQINSIQQFTAEEILEINKKEFEAIAPNKEILYENIESLQKQILNLHDQLYLESEFKSFQDSKIIEEARGAGFLSKELRSLRKLKKDKIRYQKAMGYIAKVDNVGRVFDFSD